MEYIWSESQMWVQKLKHKSTSLQIYKQWQKELVSLFSDHADVHNMYPQRAKNRIHTSV